jgi:hypothetical protein
MIRKDRADISIRVSANNLKIKLQFVKIWGGQGDVKDVNFSFERFFFERMLKYQHFNIDTRRNMKINDQFFLS